MTQRKPQRAKVYLTRTMFNAKTNRLQDCLAEARKCGGEDETLAAEIARLRKELRQGYEVRVYPKSGGHGCAKEQPK